MTDYGPLTVSSATVLRPTILRSRYVFEPPSAQYRVSQQRQNCTHKFDQAAEDPRLRFFGNVQVGPHTPPAIPHVLPISLSSLQPHYTHLLFSTGCAIPTL